MKTQEEIKKEIEKLDKKQESFFLDKRENDINLLQAELKGYQIAKQEFIENIDKCSGIKCGWMDGEICERIDKEELKKSLNSQETKSSNVLVECSSDSSPDKSLGGKND